MFATDKLQDAKYTVLAETLPRNRTLRDGCEARIPVEAIDGEELMANGIGTKFALKVVVVTGGTSGIGEACAREFAAEGAEVYALGLNAKASPLSANPSVRVVEMDVTDDKALSNFFAGLNRVDYMVPAAGISVADKEHEPDIFDKVMAVNLTAVMRCYIGSGKDDGRGHRLDRFDVQHFRLVAASGLCSEQGRNCPADEVAGAELCQCRHPCECCCAGMD